MFPYVCFRCITRFGIVETQEELEESVKILSSQNNKLAELLEKANIKVPHFVGPKLLSFIISAHDQDAAKTPDNDENEKCKSETFENATPTKPKMSSNKTESNKTEEVTENLSTNEQTSCNKPQAKLSAIQQGEQQKPQEAKQPKSQSNHQLNTLPELKEVQSFGSVDLIPVPSNTSRPDYKLHENPVKNFVEITPLVNNQKDKTSPTKPDLPAQPKVLTCVEGKMKKQKLFFSPFRFKIIVNFRCKIF